MPDRPPPPGEGPSEEGPSGDELPSGPSALPPIGARAVAFAAILLAGVCGLLIGRALADIQCRGDCTVIVGLSGVIGGVIAAGGVAVVAVLVLRAMGEWRARGAGRPGRP